MFSVYAVNEIGEVLSALVIWWYTNLELKVSIDEDVNNSRYIVWISNNK